MIWNDEALLIEEWIGNEEATWIEEAERIAGECLIFVSISSQMVCACQQKPKGKPARATSIGIARSEPKPVRRDKPTLNREPRLAPTLQGNASDKTKPPFMQNTKGLDLASQIE